MNNLADSSRYSFFESGAVAQAAQFSHWQVRAKRFPTPFWTPSVSRERRYDETRSGLYRPLRAKFLKLYEAQRL